MLILLLFELRLFFFFFKVMNIVLLSGIDFLFEANSGIRVNDLILWSFDWSAVTQLSLLFG